MIIPNYPRLALRGTMPQAEFCIQQVNTQPHEIFFRPLGATRAGTLKSASTGPTARHSSYRTCYGGILGDPSLTLIELILSLSLPRLAINSGLPSSLARRAWRTASKSPANCHTPAHATSSEYRPPCVVCALGYETLLLSANRISVSVCLTRRAPSAMYGVVTLQQNSHEFTTSFVGTFFSSVSQTYDDRTIILNCITRHDA